MSHLLHQLLGDAVLLDRALLLVLHKAVNSVNDLQKSCMEGPDVLFFEDLSGALHLLFRSRQAELYVGRNIIHVLNLVALLNGFGHDREQISKLTLILETDGYAILLVL